MFETQWLARKRHLPQVSTSQVPFQLVILFWQPVWFFSSLQVFVSRFSSSHTISQVVSPKIWFTPGDVRLARIFGRRWHANQALSQALVAVDAGAQQSKPEPPLGRLREAGGRFHVHSFQGNPIFCFINNAGEKRLVLEGRMVEKTIVNQALDSW